MARSNLTFDDLIFIARRTGVENWVDPATGKRGAVIAAPSSWRGKMGKMGSVEGVTRHHTGTVETYKPTEDYPTYQVVKEGRVKLNNSLSAYGLGRWWGIYVFSEYLSWHAGDWSYAGITDGNGHFLGTEAEGTGSRWTPFQREFYPRLTASELLFIGEGTDMMPRHADGAMPRGRKDDARNLWPTFTAEVQRYLDNPALLAYGGTNTTLEDDMPLTDSDVDKVAKRVRDFLATAENPWGLDALLGRLMNVQVGQQQILQAVGAADVNDSAEALADQLVVLLAPPLATALRQQTDGVSEEEARAIAVRTVQQAAGSLS